MKRYDFAVTITGATGFVGSQLCKRFLESEYNVRVFGADVSDDMHRLESIINSDDFTFEHYDVLQPLHSDLLAVDTLYHFAGIANPEIYLSRPVDVMDLNLFGLRNILDRVVRWSRGRPRIVFSSTSEVYGKCTDYPFNEDTTNLVYGPTHVSRWCYAMSKGVGEHYLHAFGDQVPYTIFRFFNFVGDDIDAPGSGRVITKMVGSAMRDGVIRVTAPGNQTRCFTYTEDFLSALVMPTYFKRERDDFRKENHTLNIGSTEEVPMTHLATYISSILLDNEFIDAQVPIKITPAEEIYGSGYEDVGRRVPDISKIKEEFGWEPKWKLTQFLPSIVKASAEALVREQAPA